MNLRRLRPKALAGTVRRLFVYTDYDSNAYWRSRATAPGQAAVLWTNEAYNLAYRRRQLGILSPYVRSLPEGARVLDIGCGIGVVTSMLLDLRDDITVDAVDFPEMVAVAEANVTSDRARFIASDAADYSAGDEVYDAVISSACYSAMRDLEALEAAIGHGATMVKRGGTMLMIDPFHRWSYLARARYGTHQVIDLVASDGMVPVERSGVLFWPYRVWLATSDMEPSVIDRRFEQGERLLRWLGVRLWSDYKVLVFRKEGGG